MYRMLKLLVQENEGFKNMFCIIHNLLKRDRSKQRQMIKVYQRHTSPDMLEKVLKEHLNISPHDEKAMCELALIKKEQGRDRDSISWLEKAVATNARDAYSRYLLGKFYLEIEAYEQAETHLKKAYSMSRHPECAYLLSEIYCNRGFERQQIRYLKKSILLKPSLKEPYDKLIYLYQSKGKKRKAKKYEDLIKVRDIELLTSNGS